jgi:DedD protein
MPPPSPESELKRRARRRLIGAVVLILLAVIVLPLLLEDEPPPASSLAVKMAVVPELKAAETSNPTDAETAPAVASGALAQAEEPVPEPEVVKPEPPKPAPAASRPPAPQPAKPEPKPVAKPEAKPTPTPAAAEAKPAATGKTYVVQLAALADAAKAQALQARAAETGLPTYTDTVGKLTRVRVGPFATHDAAVAAGVKLANSGIPGQVVAK